jgi:tetratricopeptide (TPR) repeat protein
MESEGNQGRGKTIRLWIAMTLAVAAIAGGAAYAIERYRIFRLARVVRESFVAGKYDAVSKQLGHWLDEQPSSGEAHYYKAWDALAHNRPREAVEAVDLARKLGYDPERLDCLTAIYHARADRFGQAEPVLERAFIEQAGPREMVAKELARIYLSSYRMDRAARAIERWRMLAPEDPEPWLWSNEIASRSDADSSVLIQNYRAALDRDPNLDKARLGLAQQLSKDRRFEEAEEAFLAYERRRPNEPVALLGLGRNAFQQGKIDDADRYFKTSFQTNPRHPETLKELGQLDLRLGRIEQARQRLKLLSEIEPYDHEVRYSYAQALRLAGDMDQSGRELERATRLRAEHDKIIQLRYSVLKNPSDLDTRFQVARWMMEHGHEDEGLKWTKEILRANPQHAPTHGVLADYYKKHGEPGLANYHRLSAGDLAGRGSQ